MAPLDLVTVWVSGNLLLAQAGGTIDIAEGAPRGTDWASTVGFLAVPILLLAAAYGGWRFLQTYRRSTQKTTVAPVELIGKEQRRRIQDAVERQDYEGAGDLLAKTGSHDEAAQNYIRARAYEKAALEFQKSGNTAQAIHYFKQAGNVATAAAIYAEQGEHMAAAAEYFAAGDFGHSAEQYALAGDDRRAAENFERSGKLLKAGKYYEVAGLQQKAAENYAAYFKGALAKAGGVLAEVEQDRQYARRAGDIFRDNGQTQKAGSIYQAGGFFGEAAQCLRTTGDFTGAAQMLMKAAKPLQAAEVLEEAGEREAALRMRAEAALADEDFRAAAALFRDAGDDERAAELFERVEEWGEAAQIHERRGMQQRAMELFERAEMWAYAARCAETAQKWESAADLYHKANDVDGELRALIASERHFDAGRLQFEHRRYDDALTTLLRIDSRDEDYIRGLELQGDVLRSQNRHEKAYSKYRSALGNRGVKENTVALCYKMARALEESDDLKAALEQFEAILEFDKNYEDVSLRTKAVRGRLRRERLPSRTASSGIFSAPANPSGEAQRYEVLEEIARGGMGIVYKARDTVLGRVVAYKVLGENLRDNETAVKYFLREARAAAALSHPNIVTVYDAGEQGNEYYMAMEFVEGTTLKELIRRKGALPEDQVRYITVHCCRALQYAHSKGIVHRDIKSGNVMITRDKALKIMDFGLAKFVREYQKDHTQQVGTPFYMSPEQIIGTDIDHRADLYSLGCTIYECATGTVPFFKGDLGYHHVHTKPPGPRGINPALSRQMEKVILRLLEKDPSDRFQHAKDIIEDVAVKERG